jgi:hypothetical protein
MAVTEARSCFLVALGPERGLDFPEMAMKNKLTPSAIVLLLVSWFALDAVAAIIV